MINNYNAFISYKHAALDNKIAEDIIKKLERYHIPKNIQKSTGHKKIDRIFRDKDELPITNDLNDTISSALANSEYLIVICSTNTKKSTWVEKEIETFLKNHTKNHVLTVLADGSERWSHEYPDHSFSDAYYLRRSNESFIVCNFKSEILEFNINDGSLLSDKYIFEEARDSISADKYCSSYALSDEGDRLALATSQYDDNRNTVYSLFEYDLLSGETIEKPLDQYLADHIQWINDHIYISCRDMPKGSLDSSTRMYNYTYITEDHTQIYCCDSKDLSTKWEDDFVCNNVMFNSGFLPMANGSVAYFSGNICEIWDSETGELIARDNGDGDNSLLHLYDIDEKKYLGSVVLEGLSSYDCNILGKYDNNLFIVGNVKEDGSTLTKIFKVNILTKDVKKRTPEQFKSLDSSFKLESFVMYGSKIVYYDS